MGEWREVELSGLRLSEPAPGDLRLRPYRAGDVDAVHAAMSSPAMSRFLALPDPYTPADAVEFCTVHAPAVSAAGTGLELAVTRADDRVVGGASLRLPATATRAAEIGYAVYPAARGLGLAARATRVLSAWAFAHGVRRIELHVAVDNVPSAATALRAGFRFETVARQAMGVTAGVVDAAVFTRLASDSGDPVPGWLPRMADVADDVLTLRPLLPTDDAAVAAEMDDADSRRWNVGVVPDDVLPRAKATALAAPLGWLVGPATRIAVVDRASGDVAGLLELRRAGPPEVVEVGYGVLRRFRGRGTTTRALRLLAGWAFGTAGIARLELGADADNLVSQTVAERAGFVRDGRCAGRLRRADGTYADEVRFGLTG